MRDVELPPGLTSRPATVDDIDAIIGLLAACEEHDDGMVEIEATDLLSEWRRPGVVLAQVTLIVFDGDQAVGFAQVVGGRVEAGVHPDHRGRGIGTALLRRSWDIARADGRTDVGQTISDHRVDAPLLFRAHGYEPVRQAWIFDIPVADAAAPVLPDGYALRAMDPERDAEPVHALIETAFNEWPDREPMPFGDWRASVLEHERLAPHASPLVVHDGAPVGVAVGFDYGIEGWVEQLAVVRAHRGRGLAHALLLDVFRRFRDRGRSTVGVSTDSRTGARGLYEHVGMRLRRSYTRWSRPLP